MKEEDFYNMDPSAIDPEEFLSKDPNERKSDDDDVPEFEEDDEKKDDGF